MAPVRVNCEKKLGYDPKGSEEIQPLMQDAQYHEEAGIEKTAKARSSCTSTGKGRNPLHTVLHFLLMTSKQIS
ncbi:hypothetical protein Y1Q_0019610 [Alligator mississippiensis]|uniref:Uncharacterized protein n=1 Tax=Alligator mississippiensis TaxID=8496 RepID=A0A151PEX2_ALLMI|nr:hypothetical protein Y1Q_0019610 [Alligator mississippiensis]